MSDHLRTVSMGGMLVCMVEETFYHSTFVFHDKVPDEYTIVRFEQLRDNRPSSLLLAIESLNDSARRLSAELSKKNPTTPRIATVIVADLSLLKDEDLLEWVSRKTDLVLDSLHAGPDGGKLPRFGVDLAQYFYAINLT